MVVIEEEVPTAENQRAGSESASSQVLLSTQQSGTASSEQPGSHPLEPSPQQPSTSGHSASQQEDVNGVSSVDRLIAMFNGNHTIRQILQVFHASSDNFKVSVECLLDGPTITSIVHMLKNQFQQQLTMKIVLDAEDIWQDAIVYYKSPSVDLKKPIQIRIRNQPAIDTDGVRRQMYDTVFNEFLTNKHVRLFDGPAHSRHPVFTAEARSSGLFKVLGLMVAHSIAQDGVGFPYLSPTCYWYIVGGEVKAMEYVSLIDVGADVAAVVSKVL